MRKRNVLLGILSIITVSLCACGGDIENVKENAEEAITIVATEQENVDTEENTKDIATEETTVKVTEIVHTNDKYGNLVKVTDTNGSISEWEYDENGNLLLKKIYDEDGILVVTSMLDEDGNVRNEETYEYDEEKNITKKITKYVGYDYATKTIECTYYEE